MIRSLSVHLESCHLYRQSIWRTNKILKEIAGFEYENARKKKHYEGGGGGGGSGYASVRQHTSEVTLYVGL